MYVAVSVVVSLVGREGKEADIVNEGAIRRRAGSKTRSAIESWRVTMRKPGGSLTSSPMTARNCRSLKSACEAIGRDAVGRG